MTICNNIQNNLNISISTQRSYPMTKIRGEKKSPKVFAPRFFPFKVKCGASSRWSSLYCPTRKSDQMTGEMHFTTYTSIRNIFYLYYYRIDRSKSVRYFCAVRTEFWRVRLMDNLVPGYLLE